MTITPRPPTPGGKPSAAALYPELPRVDRSIRKNADMSPSNSRKCRYIDNPPRNGNRKRELTSRTFQRDATCRSRVCPQSKRSTSARVRRSQSGSTLHWHFRGRLWRYVASRLCVRPGRCSTLRSSTHEVGNHARAARRRSPPPQLGGHLDTLCTQRQRPPGCSL